jgi:hypothetical protein
MVWQNLSEHDPPAIEGMESILGGSGLSVLRKDPTVAALRRLQQAAPEEFPKFLNTIAELAQDVCHVATCRNTELTVSPEIVQRCEDLQQGWYSKHEREVIKICPTVDQGRQYDEVEISKEDKQIFMMVKMNEVAILHMVYQHYNHPGFDEEAFFRYLMRKPCVSQFNDSGCYSRSSLLWHWEYSCLLSHTFKRGESRCRGECCRVYGNGKETVCAGYVYKLFEVTNKILMSHEALPQRITKDSLSYKYESAKRKKKELASNKQWVQLGHKPRKRRTKKSVEIEMYAWVEEEYYLSVQKSKWTSWLRKLQAAVQIFGQRHPWLRHV